MIQEKKKVYFKSKIALDKNNVKETWHIVNDLLGKPKKLSSLSLVIKKKHGDDPEIVANHFNEHFASVASKLVNKLLSPSITFYDYLNSPSKNSFFLFPTTPLEVKKLLSKMKSKSNRGIDEVSSKILKLTPDIFNLSINKGVFPSELKIAKVIPVLKKGTPLDVNNYSIDQLAFFLLYQKLLKELYTIVCIHILIEITFSTSYSLGLGKIMVLTMLLLNLLQQ